MFSDIISDAISEICKHIAPDYSMPEIYPKDDVIRMLESMIFLRLKSDCNWGEQLYTDEKLREMAHTEAIELYDEGMSKDDSETS